EDPAGEVVAQRGERGMQAWSLVVGSVHRGPGWVVRLHWTRIAPSGFQFRPRRSVATQPGQTKTGREGPVVVKPFPGQVSLRRTGATLRPQGSAASRQVARRRAVKNKVLRRSPGSLSRLPLRLRPDFQGLRGMPMFDRKTSEKLGGWEGYRVERIEWPQGESRTVTIHLTPSSRAMSCAHCGSRCRQVHETTVRRVRDLPLMAFRVVLAVPRR